MHNGKYPSGAIKMFLNLAQFFAEKMTLNSKQNIHYFVLTVKMVWALMRQHTGTRKIPVVIKQFVKMMMVTSKPS